MPTHKIKNKVPNPMKMDATMEIDTSLISSLVNFVDVTSYTKNQAVKNNPMAKRTNARCGYIAGFTGLIYLAPNFSMSIILENIFLWFQTMFRILM